jgi:hypothetical protein
MTGPGPTDPTRHRPNARWNPDSAPRLPDPRMIPRQSRPKDGPAPEPTPDSTGGADRESFVRPFFLTGGRTRPVHDGLRIHTLITAPPSAMHAPLRFELRQIVELCQLPRSVAEIASGLRVPLGVARVLIADLISGGYAFSHEQDEETISVQTIERIVQRVRAL